MIALISKYADRGLAIVKALAVAGLPKSSYYYQLKVAADSTRAKPGRKAPGFTLRYVVGQWIRVADTVVVDFLKELLGRPLIDYGYRKCHSALGNACYHINHKKVYRLMKEARLLRGERITTTGKVDRAGGRIVRPEAPFVFLEMDIKYLYIRGEDRTIFLLTIIDTHSRYALDYRLGYQMTQHEVKALWQRALSQDVFKKHGPEVVSKVRVRNDNGSQFIAGSVREFFASLGIDQEFTHVATPEENAHIESFHSILEEAMIGLDFERRASVADWLKTFYDFYNNDRLHSSICDLSPARFLLAWKHDLIGHDCRHGRLVFYLKIKRYLLAQTLEEITISSSTEDVTDELSATAGADAPHGEKGASAQAVANNAPT